MQEKHLKIISITLPLLFIALFSISYFSWETTEDNQAPSIRQQALKMQENFPQTSAVLASQIQTQIKSNTSLTKFEIFAEKFALPVEILVENIKQLEEEHKNLIYNAQQRNKEISKLEALPPRLRIGISAYLDINPADITLLDLSKINDEEVKFLKSYVRLDKFLEVLSQGKLTASLLKREKQNYPKRSISTIAN